ncbi:MAG: holo-ACP synthase [Pseudomonadota bacterium]
MIYGVGVDLVEVSRIAEVWERHGTRFEQRIFTPAEVEICRPRFNPAACLAMRFAAKEAFSKAVGLGLRSSRLLWRDIEVTHDQRGKPGLNLLGTAARVAWEIGITASHVSLTDEAGLV